MVGTILLSDRRYNHVMHTSNACLSHIIKCHTINRLRSIMLLINFMFHIHLGQSSLKGSCGYSVVKPVLKGILSRLCYIKYYGATCCGIKWQSEVVLKEDLNRPQWIMYWWIGVIEIVAITFLSCMWIAYEVTQQCSTIVFDR